MSASPVLLHAPLPVAGEYISRERFLHFSARSRQWLYLEEQAGRIDTRPTKSVLPNGRFAREYAVASLPTDARRRYEAEQARLSPPSQQHELPLFTEPRLALVKAAPRVRLVQHKMPEAERKQAILQPIFDMRNQNTRRIYADRLRLGDGRAVNSENRMIEYQVARYAEQGIVLHARTIKRWLAAHKAEGIAGLAKARRSDAGRSRFFSRPENRQAAALVAYLHLGDGITPGLSAQACLDMLAAQRDLVGLGEDALPCYDTVCNFLAAITPALKVYATRGRKEFAERMMPYLSRAHSEPANSIWVSDTMIADVEVMNDCIAGAPMGAPVRLRLTAIIDYRSRVCVGYSWAWEGSSASIAKALRVAISTHGPCELWYCDNGKDYCKVAKGAVPGYMRPGSVEAEEWAAREMASIERTGVLTRLGIQVTHCLAHHPQSKHVERFFRTLHLTFCKLWPTYTGGKPSERPDQTTALMHVHRDAARKGELTRSHHPLASEFMRLFDVWLDRYHNKRGHRGQGMNHRSPAEVFAQEFNPAQRPAPSHEELAYLLMDHKRATVHECQVRVNKHDYAPQDALQAHLMMQLNDRRVPVAYDPLDPARIAVLDEDGRLLTMLEAKRLARMAPDDPETQQQIAAMQQMRGELGRGLRERRTAVIRAGKQLGVLGPLQLMDTQAPATPTPTPLDLSRLTPRKPGADTKPATKAPMYAHELAASILRPRER